jgi:hypothetical protein
MNRDSSGGSDCNGEESDCKMSVWLTVELDDGMAKAIDTKK